MKLSSFFWTIILGALILRLSAVYFEVFRTNDPPTVDVDKWMAGTMAKPFATRVLVPWLVVTSSKAVPETVRERIEAGAIRLPFPALPTRLEYQMLGLVVLLFYAGYTIVMIKLARAIFGLHELPANLIAAGSLFLMPVMFMYHNYTYDPATLFFSTLLWYLMYRERWTPFFIVFLLACINKETTLVFVLSAALWRNYRYGARSSLHYPLMLLVTGVIIRGTISLLTSHAPGGVMEFHLIDHNLRHFVYTNVLDLTSTLLIGFLVFAYWHEKPELLKVGTMHLAILVTIAVFAAYLDEYRQYFDCYAILVLTIAYSLMKLGGKVHLAAPAVDGISSPAEE